MTIDISTGRDLQEKAPGEKYPFDFVFTSFKDGETIVSVTGLTQSRRGVVDGSIDLVITDETHDFNVTAQAWLAGGTSKEFYCLAMTVVTSLGATRACHGVLFVNGVCD